MSQSPARPAPSPPLFQQGSLPMQVQLVLNNLGFVDAALNAWLHESVRRGAHPDDMALALIQAGKPAEVAGFVAHLAHQGSFLSGFTAGGIDERLIPRSAPGTLKVPHAEQHTWDLGDRVVRRVMSIGSPEIAIYDGFLSDEECDFLKSVVGGHLQRSSVVGKGFTSTKSGVRTSSGAFLHVGSHPTVAAIESRSARLVGMPVENGEGLQILHYERAEEYQPHFDFFEPGTPDEARLLEAPGNRVGTMIFYLNDVEEGGATYFPRLNLAIHPRKGSALWFTYLSADGVPDQRTEHAGLPLISGTKWIATKWYRQRPFQARPPHTPGEIVVASREGPTLAV